MRIGGIIVALLSMVALLSLVWTPYDPTAIDIATRLAPPSARHWLGTDQLGRDMVSMLMAGARVSLGVSVIAIAGAMIMGVPIGLTAAGRGGAVDAMTMRGADILFAFPALLIAVLLAATLGPGAANAAIAVGLFNIPVFARVTRGAARTLWRSDFVAAARLAGRGPMAIAWDHVLPNIAGLIAVQATIQLSLALIAEAGLSYIGLGVQPPLSSWGRMLEEGQTLLGIAPRLAILPGLAISVAVLGFALLGDGLHDRLDARGGRR